MWWIDSQIPKKLISSGHQLIVKGYNSEQDKEMPGLRYGEKFGNEISKWEKF